jgi:DNA-binding transcriptional MocR family regulator
VFQLAKSSPKPLGDQLVEQMSSLIESGRLPAGSRLPSVRDLAGRTGVSAYTVTTAFERLLAKGLIESRPGSGHFVASRRALAGSSEVELGLPPSADPALGLARSALDRRNISLPAGSGVLPPAWFNDAIPTSIVSRVCADWAALTMPSPAEGDLILRELVVERLHLRGVPASANNIIMTAGASQAFDLIARTLLCPGDTVLVDDPGYSVLLTRLNAAHVQLVPVPKITEGSALDVLEDMARLHRPRFFFTQTLLHNPTGVTASVANIHGILQLADKYNFLIAEDHAYGDFGSPHLASIAQLDELRRVIYIGSFSKVLCPGMRIGFLAAPSACISPLVDAKVLAVLHGSTLDELVLRELLASGKYRKHLQRLRERVAKARHLANTALRAAGLHPNGVSSDSPFIWARVPDGIDNSRLVAEARERGILLAHGSVFSLTNRSSPYLRFNVAYASDSRLIDFLTARVQVNA